MNQAPFGVWFFVGRHMGGQVKLRLSGRFEAAL
jgi:hypothetical protein